jgi:hypothetical protein
MIRNARVTDQAYVCNSWVSALCGPRAVWGARGLQVNSTVDALLSDPRVRVLVACPETAPDAISAWLAFARLPGARVALFALTRRSVRRQGHARRLCDAAELLGAGPPVAALFDTPDGRWLRPLLGNPVLLPVEDFL